MNPNQRDPDDIGLLRILRDGLDDLTRLVTARWGRVPYMTADPTSPADGSMWIRSDLAQFRWRANGVTYPRATVILTDAAQPCTTAVLSDITWGTEVSDPDNWTSEGIATLTVPATLAGSYTVSYTGVWLSGGASTYEAFLYVNGVIVASFIGSVAGYPTITITRTLAAGDTLKVAVRQSTGGTVNIDSRLEVAWTGR